MTFADVPIDIPPEYFMPSGWMMTLNTVGCLIAVFWFLKFLKGEREARAKADEGRESMLSHLGQDCHDHSIAMMAAMSGALAASNDAIKENSRVLGETNANLVMVAQILAAERRSVGGNQFNRGDDHYEPIDP